MITALELGNFKGVSERQRLDFAPLTLLFGANNAGKSTILQAFLYALEVLERGHADVDRTELGSQAVDLGGFARIVHRHNQESVVSLRLEFDCPSSLNVFDRDLSQFPFQDLDDELDAAWIELRIRSAPGGAYVSDLDVGMKGDSQPVATLSLPKAPREGDPIWARINIAHALFKDYAEATTALMEVLPAWDAEVFKRTRQQALPGFDVSLDPAEDDMVRAQQLSLGLTPAHPIELWVSRGPRPGAVPSLYEPLQMLGGPDDEGARDAVRTAGWLLEMLVVGTGQQLVRSLRSAVYLGPLRAVPPRGFLFERSVRSTRWSDGLAAWDVLMGSDAELDTANQRFLKLGLGCAVRAQRLFAPDATAEEVGAGAGSKMVLRPILEVGQGQFLLPSEVGVGISQVIPVVLATLVRRGTLVMIEQPELHIHPALQVELGDLFIESASTGRQLIIETHSEHLILRVLRRIRETAERPPEAPILSPQMTPADLSVIYVSKTPVGMTARRLRVDTAGEFVDRWPAGFFEERGRELL